MFYRLNNHHHNTQKKMVWSLCGTLSKGINMYYLGTKMCTLGSKMYLSGTNMHPLGVNEVQRCAFWKVPSQWQFLDHLFLRVNVHTTVQTINRTVCLSFTALFASNVICCPPWPSSVNHLIPIMRFLYPWTTAIDHTLRFTTAPVWIYNWI